MWRWRKMLRTMTTKTRLRKRTMPTMTRKRKKTRERRKGGESESAITNSWTLVLRCRDPEGVQRECEAGTR